MKPDSMPPINYAAEVQDTLDEMIDAATATLITLKHVDKLDRVSDVDTVAVFHSTVQRWVVAPELNPSDADRAEDAPRVPMGVFIVTGATVPLIQRMVHTFMAEVGAAAAELRRRDASASSAVLTLGPKISVAVATDKDDDDSVPAECVDLASAIKSKLGGPV